MRFFSSILLAAAILAVQTAGAREVQKVGTTSLQTLKISTSVRAAGMGDAYCAAADDIGAVFWNPAGLVYQSGSAVMFTQINMPADIQFNTGAFTRRLGAGGVIGAHLLAMNTGDMPVRTNFMPEGTGENFIAYDVVGGLSWAQRLTDRFFFGANLRLVLSGIEDESYTGALADFGTVYQTALRSIKIGLAIQNFGPDVKYSGEYRDYLDQGRRGRAEAKPNEFSSAPPPTIYRLGLAADLFTVTGIDASDDWDGTVSIEMSHPNDNRERINIGLEIVYLDLFALRGGHKLRYKNQFGYDEERWSGGFGLNIPLPAGRKVKLDYAFVGFGKIADAADGFMASPHRFALGLEF